MKKIFYIDNLKIQLKILFALEMGKVSSNLSFNCHKMLIMRNEDTCNFIFGWIQKFSIL